MKPLLLAVTVQLLLAPGSVAAQEAAGLSAESMGWDLVWVDPRDETHRFFIEPRSVRAVSGHTGQFSVTVGPEWMDEQGDWRFAPTGYTVDCNTRAWHSDWVISQFEGQPVISYFTESEAAQANVPGPDSAMGSVIARVCDEAEVTS